MLLTHLFPDPENKNPLYYSTFISALRTKMKADTKKTYIITAAPQCPRNLQTPAGDASLPDSILKTVDHVWVQFYNNKENLCNHGLSGFSASVKAWSAAIKPAKLWIGGVSGSAQADNGGYISSAAMATEIKSVVAMKLTNLGGYMLYDAEGAKTNSNYQQKIRAALP